MTKRCLCLLLALATVLSLAAPAFADGALVETEGPIVTDEPVATEEPVIPEEPTDVPEEPTEVPEEPTEVPEAPTEVPEEPTEVPEEPTEVPEEPTEVPEEPTEVPEEPAEVPEVPAEVPEAVEEPEAAPQQTEEAEEPEAVDEDPANELLDATSGTCGALTWSMSENGDLVEGMRGWTLTISGSGDMPDYSSNVGSQDWEYEGVGASPWIRNKYKYRVTKIVVDNGVTRIGAGAFASMSAVNSVTIADSVTSIGKGAFYMVGPIIWVDQSAGLSITIPSGVARIEEEAFRATHLNGITIPEGVTYIGPSAFLETGLTSVTVPASVTEVDACAFGNFYIGSELKDITILNPNCKLYYDIGDGSNYSANGFTGWSTTVHGYEGSTAQAYADAFENISFVSLGAAPATDNSDTGFTPVPVAPTAEPAQPKVSKVTNGFEGVTITWNAVEGAENYQVYYKTGSGKWKSLAKSVTGTSYTWARAKSGTKYSFSVSATNALGSSKYNKTGKSITYMAAPKVKSAKIDASGVKITWAKVNGAAKYQVMYRTNNGKWKSLAKSVTGTSYTWKKAKAGNQYGLSVIAIAKDGTKSAYSGTGKSLVYVSAPKLKSVKKVAGGIKITWGKVNGAVEYQVMYKVGSGKWKTLTKSVTGTSYTWKKAKSGTKYTFSVRAVAADGTKGVYNTTGKSITYKK